MDGTATVIDSSTKSIYLQADAERLSQGANILGAKPEKRPPSTAGAILPVVHADGIDNEKPGWFSRQLSGIEAVAGAVGSGVADKFETAGGGLFAVARSAESVAEHPEQITAAGRKAMAGVRTFTKDLLAASESVAARAVTDPWSTVSDAGHALAGAVSTTGSALKIAGQASASAGVAAATWVGDHKRETLSIIGVAAVEALSVGTATPVVAAVAGVGGALAIHSLYSVADSLQTDSHQFSVLYGNDGYTAAEVGAARQTVGGDTAGAVISLGVSITGIGTARLLAGRVAEEAKDLVEGVDDRTAGAAGSASAHATDASPPPTAPPPHEQLVQAARVADHSELKDSTGRPLTQDNAERVAKEHPPLSAEELAVQRAAVEKDLSSYKAADGKSIMDQLNGSTLSSAQRSRVLDVLAETRSSYMRAGADGQVPTESLGSYRHTLGELKEGLESAQANGLTPRETQNALLAGMLSDSHKAGWSASTGGNFFTHHLDGALAADTILSRQMGDGFDANDLNAVRHAILEHQIGPPEFMAQAYTGEISAAMARAGVTASVEDAARIANIKKLISDPLHAPVEADSQGGYRVAFSPEERELLRRYVGEGTQNWHVPAPIGAAETATSGDALDPAKVSYVVRAADIFDNYSPEVGADGKAIKGPFKIAGLRGPASNTFDLSLADAIASVKASMRSSEGLLSDVDRARAAARVAQQDVVYNRSLQGTENWLRQRGITPGADTPYWGKPLEAPAGALPEQMKSWRLRPDVKLGAEIQAHFAQELHDMRLIGS